MVAVKAMTENRARRARRGVAAFWAMLTAGLGAAVFAGAALSADYVVNSTGDAGDGTCDGTCTLRDAILSANANTGADTISLPAGTYTLSQGGANENIAATGDLDITDNVTITGANRTTTIIDAAGIDRIFHIRSLSGATATVTVSISDLTIRNGSVSDANGGGIAIEQLGNVTLTNVNIEDNTTANPSTGAELGVGGGIYNDGVLSMVNCTISGNVANVNQEPRGIIGGGGLYNNANGDATLQSVVITANTVINVYGVVAPSVESYATGGGILNRGELLIENNSTIGGADTAAGNVAHSGAGIANIGGILFVYNTTISYNSTSVEPSTDGEIGGQGGGGIYAQNAGTDRGSVFIDSSTISYNYADRQGGGIFNSGAPLTLTHSTLDSNRARYNGAGLTNVSSVPAEITNSTFYGNRAADNNGVDSIGSNGGAIYTSSRISISSTTLYNNNAELGSQIYAARQSSTGSAPPQVRLTNTIISHGSNNTDGTNNCGADAKLAGDEDFINSLGYNVDSGEACFATTGFSDLVNKTPAAIFGGNTLANNGGPTRTVALTAESVAANRRELAGCPDDDQRGYDRQGLCDTGAYESDATVSARTKYDLKITLTESADPVTLGEQLTYTATVTNIGPDSAAGVTAQLTLPVTGVDLTTIDYDIIDDAPGTCNNLTAREVACSLGTLARRARVQIRVTAIANVATTLSVTAAVESASSESETFAANNEVTETTEVSTTGTVLFPSTGGGGGAWSWTLSLLLMTGVWQRRPRPIP